MSYDLLVVGGGINGAGIARDAAGRGLSVLLVEKDDLASATSSCVVQADPRRPALPRALRIPPGRRSARRARDLLRIAGHLTWPTRFVAAARARAAAALDDPHRPFPLRPSRAALAAAGVAGGAPRSPPYAVGPAAGAEAWLRLLRLPRRRRAPGRGERAGRAHRGARILVRTECVSARRAGGVWQAQLSNGETGSGARHRQCRGPVGEGGAEPEPRRGDARFGAAGQGQPHRAAEALRGRARLHPAERRPARGVHDSVRGPLHAGRHDRRRLRRRSGRRTPSEAEVDYLCRAAGRYLARTPAAAQSPVALRRRAAALRRRLRRPFGDHARLHLARRRRRGSGARAVGLRRQDHDLPSPRRARAGEARAVFPGDEAGLDRARAASGQRLRASARRRSRRPTSAAIPTFPGAILQGDLPSPWHAGAQVLGDGGLGEHYGAGLTERELALLHGARVGAQRRRRAVAPHQVRPAHDRGAARARRAGARQ